MLIVPAVILVLLAENAGHVKAVATMTEHDLDPLIGRSFAADGVATTVSGLFGGSGTTTYAENIGVMGFTRVYSTLAYLIAGSIAILLGLLPKFGAIISAIPIGVLGGAVTVLFGMIAVLGGRIWVDAHVDFRDPVNLVTAAVALIVGRRQLHARLGRLPVRGHRARLAGGDRDLPGAAGVLAGDRAARGRAGRRVRRPAGRAAVAHARSPSTWLATPVLRRERALPAPAAERAHEVTRPLDLDAAGLHPVAQRGLSERPAGEPVGIGADDQVLVEARRLDADLRLGPRARAARSAAGCAARRGPRSGR